MCVYLYAMCVFLTSSFLSSASSAFLSSSFLMTEWSSAIFSWNLLVSRSSTSCWAGGRREEEEDNNWKKGENADRQAGDGDGWERGVMGWRMNWQVTVSLWTCMCSINRISTYFSWIYELYVHLWMNGQIRCSVHYGAPIRWLFFPKKINYSLQVYRYPWISFKMNK